MPSKHNKKKPTKPKEGAPKKDNIQNEEHMQNEENIQKEENIDKSTQSNILNEFIQPSPKYHAWVMRQAGRYLPEFRHVRRQKCPNFLESCKTPSIAAELTNQPIYRFRDVISLRIVFSDILTIPGAMNSDNYQLDFINGVGPELRPKIENSQIFDEMFKDLSHLRITDEVFSNMAKYVNDHYNDLFIGDYYAKFSQNKLEENISTNDTTEDIVHNTTEKLVDTTTEKLVDNTTDKVVDSTTENTTDKPVENIHSKIESILTNAYEHFSKYKNYINDRFLSKFEESKKYLPESLSNYVLKDPSLKPTSSDCELLKNLSTISNNYPLIYVPAAIIASKNWRGFLRGDLDLPDDIGIDRFEINNNIHPVIGFSGAPLTLLSYMIEGGGTRGKSWAPTRKWLEVEGGEVVCQKLRTISNLIIDYLVCQIVVSRVNIVQLFDTNAGEIAPEFFNDYIIDEYNYISEMVKIKVSKFLGPSYPIYFILFPKDVADSSLKIIENFKHIDAVSISWKRDISTAFNLLPTKLIQGNLDPTILYNGCGQCDEYCKKSKNNKIENAVYDLLKQVPTGRRFIANLGHGVLPDIPVCGVETFFKSVAQFERI